MRMRTWFSWLIGLVSNKNILIILRSRDGKCEFGEEQDEHNLFKCPLLEYVILRRQPIILGNTHRS